MATPPVFADGFVCTSADGILKAKVYNHVSPEQGTRNSSVLILSGEQGTIARFVADESLLENNGASYTAKVDLRYANIVSKGATVGSTVISNLRAIGLDIDFNYAQPVANGADVEGALLLQMRDGSSEMIPMDCQRYLKN